MLTNLLVSIVVSIVTNVSVTTDEVKVPLNQGLIQVQNVNSWTISTNVTGTYDGGWGQPWLQPHEATVKTETTEVIEIKTLRIDKDQLEKIGWDDGVLEAVQKKVLSHTDKVWKRKVDWVEEQAK